MSCSVSSSLETFSVEKEKFSKTITPDPSVAYIPTYPESLVGGSFTLDFFTKGSELNVDSENIIYPLPYAKIHTESLWNGDGSYSYAGLNVSIYFIYTNTEDQVITIKADTRYLAGAYNDSSSRGNHNIIVDAVLNMSYADIKDGSTAQIKVEGTRGQNGGTFVYNLTKASFIQTIFKDV